MNQEQYRIGYGYDVHRFQEGRDLVLGGVKIPYEKGLLGHSDADVLTHAIMDAILGALSLGDIGEHFPDSDPAYQGISSLLLLQKVKELMEESGYRIGNLDALVVAQEPKLKDHKTAIKEKLAEALKVPTEKINLKATTEEGLGFTGEKLGIAAKAVCLLEKKS